MKRAAVCLLPILLLFCCFSLSCRAAAPEDPIRELRGSLSDEVKEKMDRIGYDGELSAGAGVEFKDILSLVLSELSQGMSGPLSALAVMIGVLILSSLLEGTAHALRYTETRDIMAAVTSLMLSAVLIAPCVGLIRQSVGVIGDTASLMLVYVPAMAAIYAFGGHPIQAGGTCAGVMTAAQVIAQLSAHLIPQLLCSYLALSVSCGVSGRVKLNGLCELIGKFIKWFIGIMMALFSAVLSMQSVLTRAGDSVTSRAARLTLSSLIPLIGSSLSEAYKTIQGSFDLLRTGAGVFVILAVLIAYLPLLVQCVLWMMTVKISGYAAEALGVEAPAQLLSVIGSVLSVLLALIAGVMAVFIISSAALMHSGGAA